MQLGQVQIFQLNLAKKDATELGKKASLFQMNQPKAFHSNGQQLLKSLKKPFTTKPIVVNEFESYLPTSALDRKAIPISNIDISMVHDVFISGFPIKLRLYISRSGTVVNIENIQYLDQDIELKEKLVDLLKNTTFLAAKKNGNDVDSYQDIEFSFNPKLIVRDE